MFNWQFESFLFFVCVCFFSLWHFVVNIYTSRNRMRLSFSLNMCVCLYLHAYLFLFFLFVLYRFTHKQNKEKRSNKKKIFKTPVLNFFSPFLFFGYFWKDTSIEMLLSFSSWNRSICIGRQKKKLIHCSHASHHSAHQSQLFLILDSDPLFFALLLDLFRFKNENSSIDITMTRKISLDYHNNYRSSANSSSTSVSSARCFSFCTLVKVLGFILLYWCCSISLTFFNRHIFKDSEFPLSITATHMAVKFLLASLVRACLHRISRVRHAGSSNNHERERVNLPWTILWRKVAPTGLTAALDIGLSNWSLQYITISLYGIDSIEIYSSIKRIFLPFFSLVMCKSTVIIYILVFGIIFGLERFVSYIWTHSLSNQNAHVILLSAVFFDRSC